MTHMIEQTYMDKTAFGPGPWSDEPDRVSWTDEQTGLACLAKRNHMGAWCGYVGLPAGHPWYGKGYMDKSVQVQVHGDLTYADECDGDPEHGICHVTEDGDKAWWLGFDCGHAWDLIPGFIRFGRTLCESDVYRDLAYVKGEIERLAVQAGAVA